MRDESGAISRLEGVTHLEGNFKTTKWKLTWLAESEELIPLTLVDFDHLLTKKKLEDDDEILDLITPCSVGFLKNNNQLDRISIGRDDQSVAAASLTWCIICNPNMIPKLVQNVLSPANICSDCSSKDHSKCVTSPHQRMRCASSKLRLGLILSRCQYQGLHLQICV